MGGIFAQTIVFTAFGVALSIANDRKNGAVDRFRSLPLAAVPCSRWARRGQPHEGHPAHRPHVDQRSDHRVAHPQRRRRPGAGGYAAPFAFAFAMIWIGVLIGSIVASPEGVQGIAFVALFPLTFVASTFVPVKNMPPLLQTIAEWDPVTTFADALRVQFGNPNTPVPSGAPWPTVHPLEYTLLWVAVILVVAAPSRCAPTSTPIES